MNISNRLRQFYAFPAGGYLPFPEQHDYMTYTGTAPRTDEHRDTSWVIDGAQFGIIWWAMPTFLGPLSAQRVDVHLPDQVEWPSHLWDSLDARDSMHMCGSRAHHLGIAHHLGAALKHWSNNDASFTTTYRSLPFGSYIKALRVTENPLDMEFRFIHDTTSSDKLCTSSTLATMWNMDIDALPLTLPLDQVTYRRHLAKSVSLVTYKNDDRLFIFKSRTSMPAIYHEIKMLLTIPPHPNIVQAPTFLVTILSSTGEVVVCGFMQRYYEAGALDNVLIERRRSGTLKQADQLVWAKDITSGLLHARRTPELFISDLRPDNILIDDTGDRERALLSDIEQDRNFSRWAAPEIHYLEWIAETSNKTLVKRRLQDLTSDMQARHDHLIDQFLAAKGNPILPAIGSGAYTNPTSGFYVPWLVSSPSERESAEVFTLGKVLWCLFEGVPDAHKSLGRSLPNEETDIEFPVFRHTPQKIQSLIRACTLGAREWTEGPWPIARVGGRVFPTGRTGVNGEAEADLDETLDAIKGFWQGEVAKAGEFLAVRIRHLTGAASESDLDLLDYLRRPSLQEVLIALTEFEESKEVQKWRKTR